LGSSSPPEFFLDRGLGVGLAAALRELGWLIHRAADHFPDDAQSVQDDVWMEFGLTRGWCPLHKDSRIRGREAERRPLVKFDAPMFYLDNQQLKIAEMVRRFHNAQEQIYRKATAGGAACYAVSVAGIRRTWPP
jgi:hypothetical protein